MMTPPIGDEFDAGKKLGPPMRVALWGFGSHAKRNLAPALLSAAGTELVSICSRTTPTSVPSDLVHVAFTAKPDRILEDPDIDVIFVASPTGHHFSMAMDALERGKHVWCEKPLTTSLSKSVQLLHKAATAGLVLLETDMFLHHPLQQTLRQILAKGALGAIRVVTARFGFPHLEDGNFRYSAEDGGGALLDAGFYPIAALVDLLERDVHLVGATMEQQEGFGVDTGGSALVVARDGVAGHADWGFGRSYLNEIEVWAESGYIRLERAFSKPPSLPTSIELSLHSGDQSIIEVPPASQFNLMVEEFSRITASPDLFDASKMLARATLMEAVRTGK